MFTPYSIFHSVLKNLGRCSLLFPLVLLTGLVCTTGCGQKNTDGKVRINGTVMLDGSPLICEGDGESYVNLVSETGENGGGSGSFDRSKQITPFEFVGWTQSGNTIAKQF